MNLEMLDRMVSEIAKEKEDALKEADRLRENANIKFNSQMDLIAKFRKELAHFPSEIAKPQSTNTVELIESNPKPSESFRMTDVIKNICSNVKENGDITMPFIYDNLVHLYGEEITSRKYGSIRAQISSILAKLVKQGFLYIHSKGNSSEPHIYRLKKEI